ncbi:hypothetical protein CVT25_010424 [Psilocybe cyanescens]|uniref:WSC domain-containing protein n=1 Tax=Psilocybe cyanescens TaxID=93625 RepID=A0A409XNX6_PSICY|nr:hypothetical protein CVT25_010424 [Psilocybe cyanescens]
MLREICQSLLVLSVFFKTLAAYPQSPGAPFPFLVGNTSALPAGWSGNSQCLADCTFDDLPITREFLSGPAFTDAVHMTIELCVSFCDAQGSRLAGLKGAECRCANIFNPSSCFESDNGECQTTADVGVGCPGNRRESCGLANGTPPLFNIFFNQVSQFSCSDPLWPGGAALTAVDSWRFSYFYKFHRLNGCESDSVAAHALPFDVPLLQGNLTTEACVTACGNSGFTLAGVTKGDECYCGNSIQNGARPVTTNCATLENIPGTLIPCTGNANELCGGPKVISIYTLPGTGLIPILPFDPGFDDFCSGFDCPGHT